MPIIIARIGTATHGLASQHLRGENWPDVTCLLVTNKAGYLASGGAMPGDHDTIHSGRTAEQIIESVLDAAHGREPLISAVVRLMTTKIQCDEKLKSGSASRHANPRGGRNHRQRKPARNYQTAARHRGRPDASSEP